jgi:pimeloyl-ACP methyl ester carboxylesterase
VLEAMMAVREDSPRLVLIGHSLGGSVVLRMMGDSALRQTYGPLIDRVDGVVLISPLDVAMEKVHPTFAKISSLGKFEVRIGSTLGMIKKHVAKSASRGQVDPDTVSREDVDRLRQILKKGKARRPAKAMILQAVPFDAKSRRPDWVAIERLTADYGNVDVPALILCGARDETLPASMGYKLRAQLPDARLRILRQSMHSPQTEHPVRTAGLVREFAQSLGRGWAPIRELEPEGRPHLLAGLGSN